MMRLLCDCYVIAFPLCTCASRNRSATLPNSPIRAAAASRHFPPEVHPWRKQWRSSLRLRAHAVLRALQTCVPTQQDVGRSAPLVLDLSEHVPLTRKLDLQIAELMLEHLQVRQVLGTSFSYPIPRTCSSLPSTPLHLRAPACTLSTLRL